MERGFCQTIRWRQSGPDPTRAGSSLQALPKKALAKLDFEWDVRKARDNEAKHGVAFEEAKSIFFDPRSTTYADHAHSVDERRFLTLGASRHGRILVVAHTERASAIRLISARLASRRERKYYEEENRN